MIYSDPYVGSAWSKLRPFPLDAVDASAWSVVMRLFIGSQDLFAGPV
jgi:hypothetical protein